ncbi:FecR family protein [Lutibacter citreus]|uniref:FecR family protein n=1 Tax=Lutibacter citreus TaxID=2138210 RepID=UPI000DBE4538|nr:FecR domain-containing protein [Lutibacter citreus]
MSEDSNRKSDTSSITKIEKKLLKESIFNSISKFNRKRQLKIAIISAAASIIVLLGIGAFLKLQMKSSEISEFVKTSDIKDLEHSDKVKIIIDEGEDIKIDGENTSISYSTSGSKVNVGNSKTLTQKTKVDNKVKYNTLVVPYGKRSFLTLSDGSKVWLNSGSKFVYPVNFSDEDKRVVYLVEGEAVFDVAHNAKKPFVMMTDNQEIEVLGTVFNVSNYSDDTTNFVVLKSGSVQVSYPEKGTNLLKKKKKLVISPGRIASINKETRIVTSKKVNIDHYFSWKDGILILENNELSDIVRKLSRYYNIPIHIEDEELKHQTFSGSLDLKDSVEKVIEIIIEAGTTTKLNYKITNDNLILINKTS